MFKPEQFQRIAEEIFLRHNFELPITWVMVGVNGAIFAGRFELSVLKKFKVIVLTGEAKKLRFPINMLVVDKTGKAGYVFFKRSDGPIDLSDFQMGQA